eukprot:CAMPEP_0182912810 /NCGR_PEP_ID=MMETSP0034_2-20130328/37712_1 /TAXON_ID=156128 /ORGANISM="Nephroselmis pyriformis, Strain CCMP717" /LENGTH=74 /DNA_ID=CAMNT_0025049503 /DNA_START=92 /DNA_END=316 /DNA_ORIENTATION=+
MTGGLALKLSAEASAPKLFFSVMGGGMPGMDSRALLGSRNPVLRRTASRIFSLSLLKWLSMERFCASRKSSTPD